MSNAYIIDRFEYDLFDAVTNSNVAPAVAEFVNEAQDYIIIHYRGETSLPWTKEFGPYGWEDLGSPPSEIRGAENFSIVLETVRLWYPILNSDKFTIISSGAYPKRENVNLVHYYVYFIAAALLKHRIPYIEEHEKEIRICPFDRLPLELAKGLARGRLCKECDATVDKYAEEGPSNKAFVDSVRKMLQAVAKEYVTRNEESSWLTQEVYLEKQQNARLSQGLNLIKESNVPQVTKISEQVDVPSDAYIKPKPIGNRPAPAITESKKPVDALNHRTYANAFGDLITNPKTGTPLTIGFCAPWGRGKTVLLGYIKDRIKEKSSNGTKCQCIDFNSWMYTKAEQLWAEFYSTILNSVEKGLSIRQKVQFKWYFFRCANPKLVFIWKFSLAAIVVCYLLLLLLEDQLLPVFSYIKAWWPTLLSLPLVGVLWKYFRSLSKDIFSKSKRPKFRAALGVQHEIFKYFDIVRDWLVNIAPKRIVVFIDDIDRCSPDKIMQMLESIKLLLDTENFVFVLAMDAKVVRLAVGQHYNFMAETQAKREEMGHSYLEKIVQIPFALPQASPEDLVNMKNELFKGLLEVEDKKIDKAGEAKDSAPDGKITPPPEETTEDDKKGGAESVTRVEPVDRELEMHLTKEESETLDAILKERFELSPRLLIRLKNVYLIAKHLHQAATNEPPPPEFMHWIAYSVGFPFASKAVAEACEKNGYEKKWPQVFNDIRSRMEKKPDEYNFDPAELEELQTRLSGHISHPKEIERFIKHANCFNLVLD